jgi:hypothetical protein
LPKIVALHELKATAEVGFDPAVDVLEALRKQASLIADPLVDGDHVGFSQLCI